MQEIPSMFIYNCICVMSDQLINKAGTITSGEDRFMEWKTKDSEGWLYHVFDAKYKEVNIIFGNGTDEQKNNNESRGNDYGIGNNDYNECLF